MASKISESNNHYINAASSLSQNKTIHEEVKTVFFEFKRNKSCGYGEVSINVVRRDYDKIRKTFIYIFQQTFNGVIFPEGLKIANIKPSFTGGNIAYLRSNRPIPFQKF